MIMIIADISGFILNVSELIPTISPQDYGIAHFVLSRISE